ncbi:MAG: hypothetical protein DWQ31_15340 [Planctomycetota bacterium]|nr:MAG: hypothetical protein DWQ31_15340 [Planctomycetota bacterium]REJ87428.1 MAG: hypothetical protein DWQ35_21455 [Planctomycetota bacterium]REK30780.1 MAG: hypothetical protein DWQ42_01465 [Planctomycetota bacterium]REK42160.1 MAG: hypothetical protein DWQ46_14345 [Planctomycetota bacterium]
MVAVAGCALLVAWSEGAAAEDGPAEARRVLREAGLQEVEGRWLLPAEKRLLARFRAADDWLRDAQEADRQLAARAEPQRRIQNERERLTARRQQLQEALAERSSDELERQLRQVESRLEALAREQISPTAHVELPEVRAATIRSIGHWQRLLVLKSTAGRRTLELQRRYEALSADERVRAALQTLDAGERLGSGEAFDRWRDKLAGIGADRDKRWPVYRENGRWRCGLILSEKYATTVTIFADDEQQPYPLWLPASVLQAADIEIPAEARYLTLNLPDGRRVSTRVLRFGYLRLGPHQVGGAEVLALSPDDEDLGGQITLEFLKRSGLRLDVSHLPAIVAR